MKLDTNIRHVSGRCQKGFKVRGQRSRSGIDGHRNLVNSVSPELPKESEPKLIQVLTVVRG